ncbi:MAG: hypothetical protein SynsKO_08070 [Synoicihabitans sp.]
MRQRVFLGRFPLPPLAFHPALKSFPAILVPGRATCSATPLSLAIIAAALTASGPVGAEIPAIIDFNRDVRPIISDKCFHCHGPDADNQKSDFRLDTREHAIADLGDAFFGIVPGDVEASDLHWRIWEDFEEDVMPPVSSKLSLTDTEKHILDRWIEQGAPYDEHWAFKPVSRPELPDLSPTHAARIANPIDAFITARLEDEELVPSRRAERETLIRRVTLDLVGLPPSLEAVEAFLADDRPDAWERVVDRLLASPAYGERMALVWLDAARYADSGGYQNDIKRSQWPWRDWVIQAYNANMPFDQFTVEQLAGDLLPNPSVDQRLATAFNRNHRINNEGGIIAEEYLVEYVADRTETTATVWLGLTMGCARCHDHKYDPITQRDFFELYAFFNGIPENGRDGDIAPKPNMTVYQGGSAEEHAAEKAKLARLTRELSTLFQESKPEFEIWVKDNESTQSDLLTQLRAGSAPALHLPFDMSGAKGATPDVAHYDRSSRVNNPGARPTFQIETDFGAGLKIGPGTYGRVSEPHGDAFDSSEPRSWLVHLQPPPRFAGSEGPVLVCAEANSLRGYRLMLEDVGDPDTFRLSVQIAHDVREGNGLEVVTSSIIPRKAFSRLAVTWDGSGSASGISIRLNGEEVNTETLLDELTVVATTSSELLIGARDESDAQERLRDSTLLNGIIDDVQIYDTRLSAQELSRLSQINPQHLMLAHPTTAGRNNLHHLWFNETPGAVAAKQNLSDQEAVLKKFEEENVVLVSIMEEMAQPRPTYLLDRGAYDQPDKSEELLPAVPAALPGMDKSLPRNRLGLARWIVDPTNPLTARVAVNRYWQMYFGTGLVKTPEDFGSQGALPTHPALLDWLASEFVASGWDVKAMQKLIVMSETYRQSSRVTPELLEIDPANELLARGPRFRLSGQALRDQALAVSGLLAPLMGGPPVMPYQPEGLWDELSAKGYKYIEGDGPDLYRRSLYTFWRRTVPPPSMMNFDNTAREVCSVRLQTTNTPLQALNLMNDPQFVEAARGLAERMIIDGGSTAEQQIAYGHRTVLSRLPPEFTTEILATSYEDYLTHYREKPDDAAGLIATGESAPRADIDAPRLAAMTMVASVLLNLDETVTKQ